MFISVVFVCVEGAKGHMGECFKQMPYDNEDWILPDLSDPPFQKNQCQPAKKEIYDFKCRFTVYTKVRKALHGSNYNNLSAD